MGEEILKKVFWFSLLVLILAACGGSAVPTKGSRAAKTGMPLPASELTRNAAAAETSPAESPAPTRTRRNAPKARKSATPPAPTLEAPPTQAPPATPAVVNQAPQASTPAGGLLPAPSNIAILPLILNQTTIISAASAPFPATPTVSVNKDIIQPGASQAGFARLPFFLSGAACLIGIIILVVGVTMASSFKPKAQQVNSVLNIADLQPGLGWVELQGKITQVPRPLDKNDKNPLAVLRLVIEENDVKEGWKVVLDRVESTDFSLGDGTGEVWIPRGQIDLSLLGDGAFASINQAEEALKILGLQPSSAWGRGLRYRIWELRSGQTLVAVGNLEQRFLLSGAASQSLALTPVDATAKPDAEAKQPAGSRNYLTILVFTVAAAAILVGISALIWILLH